MPRRLQPSRPHRFVERDRHTQHAPPPALRQADANTLPNLQTSRPQLQHNPAIDMHHALYPLHLRIVESNNVTRSYVTGPRHPLSAPAHRRRLPNYPYTTRP
jgi:hypothetical protein